MKRKIVFCLILFLILCTQVSAKENKLYFKHSKTGVYYDSSQLDKKSFLYHVDMIPGGSYADELVIENGTNRNYILFFKVKPREQTEETEELLNNISMKIYLDDELIYDGKAKGLDYNEKGIDLKDTIKLKEFEPKEKSIMRVETELAEEYSNKTLGDESYIDWTFYAQYEVPVEIVESLEHHKDYLPLTVIPVTASLIGLGIIIRGNKKNKK